MSLSDVPKGNMILPPSVRTKEKGTIDDVYDEAIREMERFKVHIKTLYDAAPADHEWPFCNDPKQGVQLITSHLFWILREMVWRAKCHQSDVLLKQGELF